MAPKTAATQQRSALVIVESAAKAKTIQGYLNSCPELASIGKFVVKASFGHIDNLPLKTLSVDTTTWTATYEPLSDKRKVIAELRAAVREADFVFVASDNDLEGECIADHLRTVLRLRPSASARVTFNEITKQALTAAILAPRAIDEAKVSAQEARRILDRITGYELSPLLWKRFAGAATGLSAGRVQSASLRIVVDRARAAAAHTPTALWTLTGNWTVPGADASLPARAIQDPATDADAAKAALAAVAASGAGAAWTAEFRRKTVSKSPPAPFTTSTLQQEAYSRFGLAAKDTMRIAQGLYESGKITYMRTDSTAMAEEAVGNVLTYVRDTYSNDDAQARVFKTRAANAQEAHECIRVTQVSASRPEGLEGLPARLYDLIWRRTVASQMAPAKYAELQYTIRAGAPASSLLPTFQGSQRVLTDPGYLKVLSPAAGAAASSDAPATADWDALLRTKDPIPVRAESFAAEGDVTRPPILYQESTLVKTLERLGIGRPSTYATILDKLISKKYAVKGAGPQQKVTVTSFSAAAGTTAARLSESQREVVLGGEGSDKMVPTSLGERVTDYLFKTVPYILDSDFTAKMEADLDRISHGATTKKEVLDTFYQRFHADIEREHGELKAFAGASDRPKTARGRTAVPAPGPRNVLKQFADGLSAVQTKYGPALFAPGTGSDAPARFVGLTPFLEWRRAELSAVTDAEAAFLMRLPATIPETNGCALAIGPYGFYLKTGDGRNCRLPEEHWDAAVNGALTAENVREALAAPRPGPEAASGGRGAKKYKKKWIPRTTLGKKAA